MFPFSAPLLAAGTSSDAVCALFPSDARSVRRSHKLNKSVHKIFIVERNLRTFAYVPPFFLYYYHRTVLGNQMKFSSEINTCTLTSFGLFPDSARTKKKNRISLEESPPLSIFPTLFQFPSKIFIAFSVDRHEHLQSEKFRSQAPSEERE